MVEKFSEQEKIEAILHGVFRYRYTKFPMCFSYRVDKLGKLVIHFPHEQKTVG